MDFLMAFEGMGQDREELSNNHQLKEKRGGQTKFQNKKNGKIAGITYFGEGDIIPYKKFCLRGHYKTATYKLWGTYNLQMTLP